MNDVGTKAPEQTVKLPINLVTVSRRLAERNELDVFVLKASAEFGIDFGQGDNGMAIGAKRHMVHEVDHAVFGTAQPEPVNDVHSQRQSAFAAKPCIRSGHRYWLCPEGTGSPAKPNVLTADPGRRANDTKVDDQLIVAYAPSKAVQRRTISKSYHER